MKSKRLDMFQYDPYFKTWWRVLQRVGGPYKDHITVQLTPVGGHFANGWDDVCRIRIVKQTTPFVNNLDRSSLTHELPKEVYNEMEKRLMPDTLDLLLHSDILPLIDWVEYTRNENGGTYLRDCKIKYSKKFRLIEQRQNDITNREVDESEFSEVTRVMIWGNELIISGAAELLDNTRTVIHIKHTDMTVVLKYVYTIDGRDTIITITRLLTEDWYNGFRDAIKAVRNNIDDVQGDFMMNEVIEQARRYLSTEK